MIYENLEPKKVFKFFKEISEIPHGSYNEEAISNYLVSFAKKRNLEVIQDKALNVIIRKQGSVGYEKSIPVIIQGHMDMVCEKGKNSNHDFLKDPLELKIKDDCLYANDTTLGADDGIAVAYALSILDSNDIAHPPIELVVTTSEETGMDGAMALDTSLLKGKRLLNIDAEVEGIFLTGCAGGINSKLSFTIEKEKVSGKYVEIEITNLLGGHSGIEIIKQRANANKLLGRVLNEINKTIEINLVSLEGGSKHNAIPRHAVAKLIVKDDSLNKIKEICDSSLKDFKGEYRVADPNITLNIKENSDSISMDAFTSSLTTNLIDFLIAVPDGVQDMSKDIEGLVQSSLNVAVIENTVKSIDIVISIRSSLYSLKHAILEKLLIIGSLCGASCEKISEYPEWQYDPNSDLRTICIDSYKSLFNKAPEISLIHAGLECGLFKETMKDTDMISFGPDIMDPHTPNEHLNIQSAERCWKLILKILENLK